MARASLERRYGELMTMVAFITISSGLGVRWFPVIAIGGGA